MPELEDRQALCSFLHLSDPADAVPAYYALFYDEKRTQLTVNRDANGPAQGFIAVCRTGIDLFRPLVVLQANGLDIARRLLEQALLPGRPYHVIAPLSLAQAVNTVLEVGEREIEAIYEVRRAAFKPLVNVLVTGGRDSEGKPRFVVHSASGEVVAEAGLNWQSDLFAEVYVNVQAAARGRGLGRCVASACSAYVLEAGLRPLYVTRPEHERAVHLCQALGYTDTGARMFVCSGARRAAT